MLRRLALPIGVVVLLAAIAVVSLRLGYLGRKAGGPLVEPRGFPTVLARARADRWTLARVPYEVDGGRARITAAPLALASPGMRVRGPRLDPRGARPRTRRFPPTGDRGPVLGSRLRGSGRIAFGVRVRRPGVYVAWRFALDYEQGARSYRRTLTDPPLCVALRSTCPERPRFPARAGDPLADIGGPSDYGARPTAGERSDDALAVLVPARPATRTIRFTLTNLTDRRLDVENLSLPPIASGAFRLTSTAAPRFRLAPRAATQVTLTLTGRGCDADAAAPPDPATTFRARIDGRERRVPALVALGVRAADRC